MAGRPPRRFWRDPRWWVSFELGLAISAIVLVVSFSPAFTTPLQHDTAPLTLIAVLGVVGGLALMIRFANPKV